MAPWRGVVERTLFAFLDCGIEEHGFARVCCDACRRKFRVALSCKRRGFCPSCHGKRAVLWAECLSSEVLTAAAGPVGADPPVGTAHIYFVTGETGGTEESLGQNSAGQERPNDNPCQ